MPQCNVDLLVVESVVYAQGRRHRKAAKNVSELEPTYGVSRIENQFA